MFSPPKQTTARMLLGIGVDIVHLPRIAAIVKRQAGHKFAHRILSANELEQWNRLPDHDVQKQVRFLAVRSVYSLFALRQFN